MKRGFTMIELIFVIVIIGILAVIAIPKLNATRDDAKIATSLQNVATCLQDAGSAYTATGEEKDDSAACGNLKCFKITLGTKTDGNITIDGNQTIDGSTPKWCEEATNKASARKILGDHIFGGNKIKE